MKDVGLLVLRLGAGGMMMMHGLAKAQDVMAGHREFADPIGIGPFPTLLLAVFAELLCALAVAVGFRTRWAAVPVMITMLVAAFVVHGADPWDKKEFPLLYATAFLALVFTGGGRYAVDSLFGRGGGRTRRKG